MGNTKNYFNFSKVINKLKNKKDFLFHIIKSEKNPKYGVLFITTPKLLERECCLRISPSQFNSNEINISFVKRTLGNFYILTKGDESTEVELQLLIEDHEKYIFDLLVENSDFFYQLTFEENITLDKKDYYRFFSNQFEYFLNYASILKNQL